MGNDALDVNIAATIRAPELDEHETARSIRQSIISIRPTRYGDITALE